jgi:hypothetical protein
MTQVRSDKAWLVEVRDRKPTAEQLRAAREAKAILARRIPEGVSLVDELIAERRRETV